MIHTHPIVLTVYDKMSDTEKACFDHNVEALLPDVVELEKLKMGENNYITYLPIVNRVTDVLALIAAGGNVKGILSAAKVNGVLNF